MKIAVWHNLPSGGGKRALYQHIRGLVAKGHTVEAWCPPTADQTYLPLSDFVPEHIIPLSADHRPQGLSRRLFGAYHVVVSPMDAMDAHCRECAQQINSGGFDLFFGNSCPDFAVTSIGRHIQIPKVLYLQEPCRSLYEASPHLLWNIKPEERDIPLSVRGMRRAYHDTLFIRAKRVQSGEETANARAYDMLLVNSYFSRESVLRAYGCEAKVCYLGIDTGKFHPQPQTRQSYALGLGALHPGKNSKFLIEAVAAVKGVRPRLLLIGNSSVSGYTDELMHFAQALEVALEIKLRVSDDELVAHLNEARMLLYAPRLEPFGYAPLEANACGLPVIAVAEGGVRETITDGVNGLLVAHEPRAMAEAIERLRDDQDLADQLGKNAHEEVVGRWSYAASIDRLEQRFNETLALTRK